MSKLDVKNNIINLKYNNLNKTFLKEIANEVMKNKFYSDVIWPDNKLELLNDLESAELIQSIELNLIKNNEEFSRFPTDYVHGLMSYDVFRNFDLEKEKKVRFNQEYWKIIDIYEYPINDIIGKQTKGSIYFGVLYLNKNKKQLVLAHRGLNLRLKNLFNDMGDLQIDINNVLIESTIPQIKKCLEFTEKGYNLAIKNDYFLSFTGFSNGAYMAEHSYFYCEKVLKKKKENLMIETKAVLFESPGLWIDRNESNINIVNYVQEPNIFTTSNQHSGKVYRIFNENIENEKKVIDKFLSKINEIPIIGCKFNQFLNDSKFFLNGISTIFNKNRNLSLILESFDKITGKPKYCEEIIEWPCFSVNINSVILDKIKDKLLKETENYLDSNNYIVSNIIDCLIRNRSPSFYFILNFVVELFKSSFNISAFNSSKFNQKLLFDNLALTEENDDDIVLNRLKYVLLDKHDQVQIIEDRIDKYSFKLINNYTTKVKYRDLILVDKNDSNFNIGLYYLGKTTLKRDHPSKIAYDCLNNLKSCFKIIELNYNNKKLDLIYIKKDKITIENLNERLEHLFKLYPSILNDIIQSKDVCLINVKPKTKFMDFSLSKDKYFIKILNYEEMDKKFITNKIQFGLIYGPNGIGKTMSAYEYGVYLAKNKNYTVHAFLMDTIDNITSNYILNLFELLELDKNILKNNDNQLCLNLINENLHQINSNILFIFDDIDLQNEDSVKFVETILVNLPKNVQILATTCKISFNESLNYFTHTFTLSLFGRFQASTLMVKHKMEKDIEAILNAFKTNEFNPLHISLIISCLKLNKSEKCGLYIIKQLENNQFKKIYEKIFLKLIIKNEDMCKLLIRLSLIDWNDINIEFLSNFLVDFDQEKLAKLIDKLNKSLLIRFQNENSKTFNFSHQDIHSNLKEIIQVECKKDGLQQICSNDLKIFTNMMKKSIKRHDLKQIKKYVEEANSFNLITNESTSNLSELNELMADYLTDNHMYTSSIGLLNKSYEINSNNSKILIKLALNLRYIKDYNKSNEIFIKSLDQYYQLYPNIINDIIASIYNYIGLNHVDMKLSNKSIEFFEKSIEIYEKINFNESVIADVFNNIGKAYLDLGNYQVSLDYLKKSYEVKSKLNVQNGDISIGEILYNIGGCYFALRMFSKSIENYQKSLEQMINIEKKVSKNYSKIASIYNNIGVGYLYIKDFNRSIDFLQKSIDIHETVLEMKDIKAIASIFANIGTSYSGLQEYEKSIRNYEKSIDLKKKLYSTENNASIASTLNDMGSTYRNSGNFEKSIEFYNKSLNIYKYIYSENSDHPVILALMDKIRDVTQKIIQN